MKIENDNLLDTNNDNFKHAKLLVNLIANYYQIKRPVIESVDYNENKSKMEIDLKDKNLEIINYKVMIINDDKSLIFVKLSNKDYTDEFKLYPRGFILRTKIIYENERTNTKIETIDLNQGLTRANSNIRNYKFNFKNKNLNANVEISIPNTHPFVYNMFIKYLLNLDEEIEDISNLYYIIKHKLNCKDAYIKIENLENIIYTYMDKLLKYKKIVGNKTYEYRDGDKELTVTEINHMNLDSSEFQMILRKIRS